MAKKMRLEPNLEEAMQKVLNIQDLLVTPEAKKLQVLDQKMQKILEDKDLGLAEKIKQFELTLGEFRHIQDRIIEQGTTSMADRFRNDSWKEEMRDLMQSMLDETVTRHLQNQTSAMESSRRSLESDLQSRQDDDSSDSNTPAAAAPIAMSTPAVEQSSSSDQLPESPPSAMLASNNQTPSSSLQPHSSEKSNSLRGEIEKILKSGGMKVKANRYLFPILDSATRTRLKKQHQDYAASTFQRVLNVLTSENAQLMPLNASGIVDCVKKILGPARPNFTVYFDEYPNLKNMFDSGRVVNFDKWSSFHDYQTVVGTPKRHKK
jgi:nucleoside diphosphate kinase